MIGKEDCAWFDAGYCDGHYCSDCEEWMDYFSNLEKHPRG